MVLSPAHQDLARLGEAASRFLAERFARLPRDSGLKHFLATPNEFGWDLKRKLLWAGINSYLFRFLFFKYLDDQQRKPDITAKDDFVCGHCTEWSGLGVIDVLAGALDLPENDRATLRTWYERHRSFFRVLARHEERGEVKTITARNLVNGQPYTIRMNMSDCPFHPGLVVYGALTPWRGEWYWSGEQESFEDMPEHEEATIRKEMLETAGPIAYRFCPDEAAKARALTQELHVKFVAHYGGDLVSFPDGLALAAAEQKRMGNAWAAASPEHVARLMKERGLNHPRPNLELPPEFLNHDQGIGAFSNPDEGVEFMLGFNQLLSGFRKKGQGLTEEEMRAVRGFVGKRSRHPCLRAAAGRGARRGVRWRDVPGAGLSARLVDRSAAAPAQGPLLPETLPVALPVAAFRRHCRNHERKSSCPLNWSGCKPVFRRSANCRNGWCSAIEWARKLGLDH